ncbi:DUF6048 family protein [Flavobacterium sp. NRK F10]|uniref:Outer membrane protein beta-barrel domain-containing protein n=1 Tax=Flavobacterium sediminis TaxID=2201181 RepID=A0A2U8QWR8_9FLAO|nr:MULTISPECIES: DUF6048 family protein [Flavobacterium]AWM14499.1 hypothetical protein DI487_11955 [Flavobacterium sediminis]MCO6175730.1 DUF6048 family protein [Flavobacterium sp. NRK F10]
MKYTLNYIFSFIALILVTQINAQDSIKTYPQRYGLRIGVDLHRLSKSFYDSNYKGLELVGDYRLTNKFYIAGEIGNEEKTVDDDRFNFTTNGSYFKIGFDYNAYENWLDMENMIYTGMRVGISTFSHTLDSYKIYDPLNYYGENIVTPGQKFDGLSASWIEVIGGIKAELFNNVFLGFSVRLNYLVSNKKPDNFDNLFIPGYNRTYEGKFGAGFNYTLSYFIPIYKKKK